MYILWWFLLLMFRAEAQILTENAGTVSPESPGLREVIQVNRSQGLNEVRITTQGAFSWEPGEELRISLPYTFRSGSGLGDASLRYKKLLLKEDEVMASERLSLLAELMVPSGRFEASGPPRELQNGMGSWQLGVGVAYTQIQDRHRRALEVLFRQPLNGPIPQQLDANLAYWYRLTPAEFGDEPEVELRGVIELITQHRFGGQLPAMRGSLVWLAPGLQIYASPEVQFEVGLQIPIAQSVGDALGRRNTGGLFSVKLAF